MIQMKKINWPLAFLCLLSISFSACQRMPGEVLEDSKTGMRHINQGFMSIFGYGGQSRQVASREDFQGPIDDEYVPLADEDLYRQLSLGDADALAKISQDSAIPQSKEAVGEVGSNIPGIDRFEEPSGHELSAVFQKIHFSTNDHIVRGRQNLEIVDRIVDYMSKESDLFLFVEGHCDERGAAAYNLSLGSKRSNSVRNLIVKGGVDLNRVFTISYGKERPSIFGFGEDIWRQNRRAQFKIYRQTAKAGGLGHEGTVSNRFTQ